ncbi:hypothetical protein HNY73_001358 [Argiope bruennichi]|uniref:Uncharacterized protein n=1 Tax=Argiope bruennichi TaxID=94029 RepID=A0A8T0G116_ARGBR|nr:hypothetical protein HNY73_001358 [Argiope bruennichi]
MLRYFLCLLLAVSCCALDLFSVKGRPTGVSLRLRNVRSSVRTTPKFMPSTSNKVETRNFEATQTETTLKDNFVEDASVSENETNLDLLLNQNTTAVEVGLSLDEANENSVSNKTGMEFNKTMLKNEAGFETEVLLGDVLKQRIELNESGNISSDAIYQSTEIIENGLLKQDNINQNTANGTDIQTEALHNMEESITSEEQGILQKSVQKRSIRNLSPGEEFLLSVANFEDAKSNDWKRLPYLMNLLQKGKLTVAKEKTLAKRKDGVNRQSEWPMEMLEMMKDLEEEEEDRSDESDKSTSLLSKWSADPMSLILSAIIPISVLIAAVLPILSDQFTTGMYMPSVSTTATGDRSVRKLQEKNTTEFFVPLLENLVASGAQTFDNITEERYNETKTRFLKETFERVTSFVNDRWKSLVNRLSKHKISCDQQNCTAPVIH